MRKVKYLALDICLVAIASVGAEFIRDNLEFSETKLFGAGPYILLTCVVAAVIFPLAAINRSIWRLSTFSDYNRILVASVFTVALSVSISFAMTRMDGVARSVPILQVLLMVALLVGARLLARQRHHLRDRPRQLTAVEPAAQGEHILVIGMNRLTDLFLRAVADFHEGHSRVEGVLTNKAQHVGRTVGGHKILGTAEDLRSVVRDLEVHGVFIQRVVVAMRFDELSASARDQLLTLEKTTTIKVDFVSELMGLTGAARRTSSDASRTSPSGEDNLFRIEPVRLQAIAGRRYWAAKRALDVALVLALAPFALPLGILLAFLLSLDVGQPVLFWQQRPGVGGMVFRLYKFRTMSSAHDEEGQLRSDAERTSWFGALLRRTRLDELPQLFNILRGDMSFVGPRPLLPVDQRPEAAARLLVRPGLTGWAQVRGGRTVSAEDKAALDVWYVLNASLLLDLRILACTVPMVLFGERVSFAALERAWQDLRAEGVCDHPVGRVV